MANDTRSHPDWRNFRTGNENSGIEHQFPNALLSFFPPPSFCLFFNTSIAPNFPFPAFIHNDHLFMHYSANTHYILNTAKILYWINHFAPELRVIIGKTEKWKMRILPYHDPRNNISTSTNTLYDILSRCSSQHKILLNMYVTNVCRYRCSCESQLAIHILIYMECAEQTKNDALIIITIGVAVAVSVVG